MLSRFILHCRRKTCGELAAYARANPGTLSYATPGVGTGNHLVGEMFKQRAGAPDIVHLPYRGMGPAINDLIRLCENSTGVGIPITSSFD